MDRTAILLGLVALLAVAVIAVGQRGLERELSHSVTTHHLNHAG